MPPKRKRYAAETRVPIAQSRADIEKTLARYGADKFGFMSSAGKFSLMFEIDGRAVQLVVPTDGMSEQETRAIWRAALLCIKAKLECVSGGIETFDEAFLAHIVTKEGNTVAEQMRHTELPGGPLKLSHDGRATPPRLRGPA